MRVGLSGWAYDHWDGGFYPAGIRGDERLSYVAGRFDTVEVNRSFYSLLSPDVYRRWHDGVPDDFLFSVKGSRFITHMRKLRDIEIPLANFFASGVLELKEKLGPILWQLPSSWGFDKTRVEEFLAGLPRSTVEAAVTASGHDERVGETAMPSGHDHPIRHALEVRHPSAFQPDLAEMAAARGVAIAISHSSVWRYVEELTADFAYVRLHGPAQLYSSRYSDVDLERWRDRITVWSNGGVVDDQIRLTDEPVVASGARDVFVYFDNDGFAHAPNDALALKDLLDRDPSRGPGTVIGD